MKEKIENIFDYISFIKKILIILGFAILILFLYKILNIIIILSLSLFLGIIFSPFLNKLNKWKINDFFGIILIFFILLLILSLVIFLIVPLIVNQSVILFTLITDWANNQLEIYNDIGIGGFGLPILIENFLKNLNIEQILSLVKDNSSQISIFLGSNIKDFITSGVGIISSVTSSIFNIVIIFFFTIFIALERKNVRSIFYSILPIKLSKYFYNNEKNITNVLSVWLKGQLILSISMFFLTLIGLLILKLFGINIDGILTLSLIAGFMEFIPYIGTFISFFLAISISIGIGINAFIGVLIIYLIIQQIEGNFLVPYIMGKTLSLSPFIVLLSMTIGGILFGIIGIIFTIPVISIIDVFLKPYIIKRKKENYFIK